ncbi:ARID DNA-binding domain-containing protein [Tanacetum coccineum]
MQKANSTSGKWQRPMKYSYGLHNNYMMKVTEYYCCSFFRGKVFFIVTVDKLLISQILTFGREITRDCRDMLRKKLEEIEAYNASKIENKMIHYNCFYCNMDGHITKTCPSKVKDDALGITQKKYPVDKSMILCFRCRNHGHFANKCPTKHQIQSTVSLKYPEFIHFKTRSIVKGTDEGTWDDYWYVSASTNKHLTSNLNFFVNIKEEFLVEKIEGQKKFLFTYGIGEVLIKNGSNTYLIPGVHYAPETTLNILSINLLRQQGFELIFEEEKCTLEYMFKTKQGKNLDVDRMKQMHNNYLDDYFESLDKERMDREEGKARPLEATEQPEVHNFHGFVDFLNLIKKDEIVSREWDAYRSRFDKVLKWFYNHYLKKELPGIIPPTIDGITIHLFDLYKLIDWMGGYLSVHFGLEFGALAETLGLTRSDGEKIRKCYETYLEVFVSYYKTARAPENPIRIGEDSESLDEYQWKIDEKVAPEAVGKGKEKLEHFGIKLEEEEACKPQQTAHYGKEESQIKCYKCQDLGHYAFECPLKNKRKDQNKVSSYKASTSNLAEGMDSNSTSSDDYLIIT